jgi:hypothetical protein
MVQKDISRSSKQFVFSYNVFVFVYISYIIENSFSPNSSDFSHDM